MIDWQKIAPDRADWERFTDAFTKAGLPACRWVNGEPVFDKPVDEARVLAIVHGESPPFSPDAKAAPAKRKPGRPKK